MPYQPGTPQPATPALVDRMDVICERCHTRYEFDEALVSARGTTVKCTQCGLLFKVHAPEGTDRVESWTVQRVTGERFIFRQMRELQSAIASGRVVRDDVLIPSTGRPRRIGDIEELEGFFPAQGGLDEATRQMKRAGSTRIGVPPPAGVAVGTDRDGRPLPTRTGTTLRPPASVGVRPMVVGAAAAAGAPARGTKPSEQDEPTARTRPNVDDEETAEAAPPAAPSSSMGETFAAVEQAMSTALSEERRRERAEREELEAAARPTLPRAVAFPRGYEESELDITQDDHRELADGSRPIGREVRISEAPSPHPVADRDSGGSISIPPLTPSPSVARPSILRRSSGFGDPRFSSYAGATRQPSFARWIAGLIVLGVLGVVAFTLVHRYLRSAEPVTSAAARDPRVDKLLRAGQDKLIAGDVDGAREQFVMASGVSDTDPRVVQALADVDVVRADVRWLHLELLAADDPARESLERELEKARQRAEESTGRAQALAPKERATVRLRIAVLRLKGDREGARSLVEQLRDPGPEDGLVLAALDLSEAQPSWPSVLDRLATAARAEQRLGRARAMLIYALARAGRKEDANDQLDLLASYQPPHELLEPLRRFVAQAQDSSPVDAATDGGAGGAGSAAAGEGDTEIPTDFRDALRKAHAAQQEGQLDRAETLYRAALLKSPGNSEALAGLAEVARARGDTNAAIAAYETLLRSNPGYVPGLAALADLKWQAGRQGEAAALYRQVVEAAPGSSYATHAQSRLDSMGKTAPAPTESRPPSTTPTTGPTASPPPPSTGGLPPGVDTSDLPELR